MPLSPAVLTLAAAFANPADPLPLPPFLPAAFDTAVAAPAVTSSNTFGINLHQQIAKASTGNVFYSPYSVSVALTMAAEGAREQTEQEMASVLAFPPVAGGRPIAAVNTGHRTLRQRFAEASGSADPAVRRRLDDLARELDAANTASRKLEDQGKWSDASTSYQKATKLAAELNTLRSRVDRFDLRVVNALWTEQTFSLLPAYVRTIDQNYGSGGITPCDFIGKPEACRNRINDWVEQNTEHRIKDLLPQGSVTRDTRLVIANAVYFRGEWADPFNTGSTKEEDFRQATGPSTKAFMMHAWRSAPYAAFTSRGEYFATPTRVPVDPAKRPATYPDDDGFTMMALPYKGNELDMVVILPRTPGGLPAIESLITSQNLTAWLARFENRTVETAFPRFKLGYDRELSQDMKDLGMKRAFVSPGLSGGAQFGGMSSSEDPSQQLSIGIIQHKAWIEVNEKGTEAAAATAVALPAGAAMHREETVPFNPVFCADHPFLFVIRDTKTNLILFVGRVTNPAA